MSPAQTAPYGSWNSPITTDLIVSAFVGFGTLTPHGEDLYYIEARPKEKGRQVLVRRGPGGEDREITPAPFNVRSRVNEYGGRAYTIGPDGTAYFSNYTDQRIYKAVPGRAIEPLTPEGPLRFADYRFDAGRDRLICVQEDHTHSDLNAVLSLVSLRASDGGDRLTLVGGHDFYAAPALSPDGKRLAWLAWNHPNMPWDGTELWLGELDDQGAMRSSRMLAGGPQESIFQPLWSPDGELYFISDRTGWWNFYRWEGDHAEALYPMEAEFGDPLWTLDTSTYGFLSADKILCRYDRQGLSHLAELDLRARTLRTLDTPYNHITELRTQAGQGFFLGASPLEVTTILKYDPGSGDLTKIRARGVVDIDPGYISIPETIEFPTTKPDEPLPSRAGSTSSLVSTGSPPWLVSTGSTNEGDWTAFGLFYPPQNRDFTAPEGEKPPLIVFSHGGPTGQATPTLDLRVQFWTSRGFGVLDVNYGGSSGFGRAYRERLKGNWGIVDIADCANGALYLAAQGRADRERLAIRGGSAGGFTTLGALTFTDVFKAGASYYGIGDLITLEGADHKFESRYNHSLVGPYPQRADLYRERSAIYHVDRLNTPIILFQGLEDRIVPPDQSQTMYEAVKSKGLPVAYLAFEGEQHGFRKAETIQRSLEAEYYFYAKVFGFEPADEIEPVPIENL